MVVAAVVEAGVVGVGEPGLICRIFRFFARRMFLILLGGGQTP